MIGCIDAPCLTLLKNGSWSTYSISSVFALCTTFNWLNCLSPKLCNTLPSQSLCSCIRFVIIAVASKQSALSQSVSINWCTRCNYFSYPCVYKLAFPFSLYVPPSVAHIMPISLATCLHKHFCILR